jgi:hypothetical protein
MGCQDFVSYYSLRLFILDTYLVRDMGEGRAEGTDYISLRISGRTNSRNSEGDTILRGYFPFV